jgi:hypothetical protein
MCVIMYIYININVILTQGLHINMYKELLIHYPNTLSW